MARPPRPPRTDLGEIDRNRSEKTAEVFTRAESIARRAYGPVQLVPTEPTARATAIRADAARIVGDPAPASPEGASQTAGEMSPKDWLTAEDLELLSSPDTCPNTLLAKAIPKRPDWIVAAFVESVAVAKEKFGPAPQGLPLICRMQTPMAAKLMLEPTHDGITALHAHADRVVRQFAAFAARVPLPSEYSDLFMKVIVPTYNAVSFDSRRCLDCGQAFALRATGKKKAEEREEARYCPVCYPNASERERVRNQGRKRPSGSRQAVADELAKLDEKHRHHFKACQICKSGRQCEISASMLMKHDALNRMHEQWNEKHDKAEEPEELDI